MIPALIVRFRAFAGEGARQTQCASRVLRAMLVRSRNRRSTSPPGTHAVRSAVVVAAPKATITVATRVAVIHVGQASGRRSRTS